MHGLVNKGMQGFLTTIYGEDTWQRIAEAAGIGPEGFEFLITYDVKHTWDVLNEASIVLGKTADTLLEDLGTYLVSDKSTDSIRRLLRFGGEDFADFVSSIDELPERARLAVPNLMLPDVEVNQSGNDQYEIRCVSEFGRFGKILSGILRAMADDYGCLSLIEWEDQGEAGEVISVTLLDGAYSEGKTFALSAGVAS